MLPGVLYTTVEWCYTRRERYVWSVSVRLVVFHQMATTSLSGWFPVRRWVGGPAENLYNISLGFNHHLLALRLSVLLAAEKSVNMYPMISRADKPLLHGIEHVHSIHATAVKK